MQRKKISPVRDPKSKNVLLAIKKTPSRHKQQTKWLQIFFSVVVVYLVYVQFSLLMGIDNCLTGSVGYFIGCSDLDIFYNNEDLPMHFDIAVPAANRDQQLQETLVPSLGKAFADFRKNSPEKTVTFRLWITRYSDEDSSPGLRKLLATKASMTTSDSIQFVSINKKSKKFQRAEAINEVQTSVCKTYDCLFAVLDVDMEAHESFIRNSLLHVTSRTSIYFPVVWSEYEPRGVEVAEKVFGYLPPFSSQRGLWHRTICGIYVMKGSQTDNLKMDYKTFTKWGGEDVDFIQRVFAKGMNIVREREPGLIHKWHKKACSRKVLGSSELKSKCVKEAEKLEGAVLVAYLKDDDSAFFDYIADLPVTNTINRTEEEAVQWISGIRKNFEKGGTGSFGNCSRDTEPISRSLDGATGYGSNSVACRSFNYRVPIDSFQKAGSLIVGVLSSANSTSRRKVIRSTWASSATGVFFLVAGPWSQIANEFEKHRDLIWVEQEEKYTSLTYKTGIFFHIVNDVGSKLGLNYTHVMKTDEDSYVALDRVQAHMDWWDEPNHFWGHCHEGPIAPVRDLDSKWKISEAEYPEAVFPAYCQGAGFVLSRNFVQCASSHGHIENTRFMVHEDVFVGFLAERCGITAINAGADIVRVWRTGWKKADALEEKARVNEAGKKIPDGSWMPPAEMAGRIIQHRVNSDKDMEDHHRSILRQRKDGLATMHVNDAVEYYSSDNSEWLGVWVADRPKRAGVSIFTTDDNKRGLYVRYRPYLGEWRKASNLTRPVEMLIDNRAGISRDFLPRSLVPQRKPSLTDVLMNRFIVVPEYKLLFCYIEKSGCTMFNNLFRILRLYHPDLINHPEEAAFQANATWYRNTPDHHSLEREDLEELLRDPEWTKAMFYRDPVSRFVSAFRSKCDAGEADLDGRFVCNRVFGRNKISFVEAVEQLEEQASKVFSDQHFAPTSHFCGGLSSTLMYYDFVHEIDPETTPQHIESLFQAIGVDPNVTTKIVDSVVRSGGAPDKEIRQTIEETHGIPFRDTSSRALSSSSVSVQSAYGLSSYFENLEELVMVQRAYEVDYNTFKLPRVSAGLLKAPPSNSIGNVDASLNGKAETVIHDLFQDDDVLALDTSVVSNIKATLESAQSSVEEFIGDNRQRSRHYHAIPLMATVDSRPIVQRKQQAGISRKTLLGCPFTFNTFVSDLNSIDVNHMSMKSRMPASCSICFEFSTNDLAQNFLRGQGQVSSSKATKCVTGNAELSGANAHWQVNDERFVGYGYIWNVDCQLPNGIKELTCREISILHDSSDMSDSLHTIRLHINFTLPISEESQVRGFGEVLVDGETISIESVWPWEAVRSPNDRPILKLPAHRDDDNSPLVPSSPEDLKLLHVEGPVFDDEDKLLYQSGAPFRLLAANLLHFARLAPQSTHMVTVVHRQLHSTLEKIKTILDTSVHKLYPNFSPWIHDQFLHSKPGTSAPLLLRSFLNSRNSSTTQNLANFTLREFLRWRGVRIQLVPVLAPPLAFEKSVCGTQYQVTSYIPARYAPEFHVMMYLDTDVSLLEGSRLQLSLQEIIFNRMFSTTLRHRSLNGFRFVLAEQYVEPGLDSVEALLNCTHQLATNPDLLKNVLQNCTVKEGHIVARTDSLLQLNVHTPMTLPEHITPGVEDYSTGNISTRAVGNDEVVEIHLRNRQRKPECSCSSSVTKSSR